MKRLFVFVSIFVCSVFLFAAQTPVMEDSVKTYRKAKECFEEQDYGKALKYAEDAITYKKQQAQKECKILNDALSPKRVQAAGSKINDVVKVLQKRDEKEAVRLINLYVAKHSTDFFNDDINQLVKYINECSEYPEAQKIIGDVYKMEGEYEFAEEYYLLALKNKAILDIPDEKYEILYMLADLSRLKGNDEQMETRLLNIIADDENFRDTALFNAIMNTIKADSADSVEKFFTLYRADSFYSLDAYNQLKVFYNQKGLSEKALQFSALSALTGFTKIVNILQQRNVSYEYTDLIDFFQEASHYDDIIQWGAEHSVWESFNDFAYQTKISGYKNFSQALFSVIAQNIPDSYWQKNAVLQLSDF